MRRTRIGCGVFVVLERHAEPSTARLVARGAPRVDFEHLEPGRLPIGVAVSAITMAEIAAGPHPTGDAGERARRHDRGRRRAGAPTRPGTADRPTDAPELRIPAISAICSCSCNWFMGERHSYSLTWATGWTPFPPR